LVEHATENRSFGGSIPPPEFRAQTAEAEAREAKQALEFVEEAIRRRLLRANPEAYSRLSAVA
jgi:hypothetical protein